MKYQRHNRRYVKTPGRDDIKILFLNLYMTVGFPFASIGKKIIIQLSDCQLSESFSVFKEKRKTEVSWATAMALPLQITKRLFKLAHDGLIR